MLIGIRLYIMCQLISAQETDYAVVFLHTVLALSVFIVANANVFLDLRLVNVKQKIQTVE